MTRLVAEAVAEHKGIDPFDPDFSLYEHVDTEALDDLFASVSGTKLRTEFSAAGVSVCACKTADGELVVRTRDADV